MIRDFMQAVYSDLAPSGTLRAAVNYGNPMLVQRDIATGEPRGLAVSLVEDLARRLSLPRQLIPFDAASQVFDAGLAGGWDIAFLAIDSTRSHGVDFTPPLAVLEGTYLVHDSSPIRSFIDLDQPGVRIGLSTGTVYDSHLTRTLKHATLVRSNTSPDSLDLFLAKGTDSVAGLRHTLVAYAQAHSGLRIIEGRFAAIGTAIAVPKGRCAGLRYLSAFVEDIKKRDSITALGHKESRSGETSPPRSSELPPQ